MKLSIVIPAYNEEKTILQIISKIKEVDLKEIKKEIIVVDDASTDTTWEKLREAKDNEVKIVLHQKNRGKGAAIRTGLEQTTGDITIIQDADLEYDPQDYPMLIKPIINKITQVVYGSRRLKKTNEQYAGLKYYIGGIGLTKITNLLYNANLTDEATCYKVFDTKLLKELNLECERFEFCPEVTAKVLRKGIKILEVPINYYPRSIDEGKKIRMKDGFEAVWTLLKWRFKRF
jgi:dolichol-phosphate mannosyltransferase